MSIFRTRRPLLVDANQCSTPTTVHSDDGLRHVKRGDWIIRGENGECYVVDDTFFQRTFAPETDPVWEPSAEGRHYGC